VALHTYGEAVVQGVPVLPDSATIGHNVVIEYGAVLGENVRIDGNCYIYACVTIHDNVYIQAGSVIGSPAFTYKTNGGIPVREDSDGEVVIESDVEIGSCVVVDRGRVLTILKQGCKIDNLVHVAHDCCVGSNTLLVAGTVLGGHVTIGEGARVSINASIRPRVTIGDGVLVRMDASVSRDVPDGESTDGRFLGRSRR